MTAFTARPPKGELRRGPVLGLPERRLASRYVETFETHLLRVFVDFHLALLCALRAQMSCLGLKA